MTLKERAKKLKLDLPAIFLALKKKETPKLAKLFAGITIAYALSPIDLVPDFIPVLGYLDDVLLLPLLITLTVKCIPDRIYQICLIEAKDLRADKKPKKWYYSIPIIIIWILAIVAIIKAFL